MKNMSKGGIAMMVAAGIYLVAGLGAGAFRVTQSRTTENVSQDPETADQGDHAALDVDASEVEDHTMTEEEYEEFMKLYGSQFQDPVETEASSQSSVATPATASDTTNASAGNTDTAAETAAGDALSDTGSDDSVSDTAADTEDAASTDELSPFDQLGNDSSLPAGTADDTTADIDKAGNSAAASAADTSRTYATYTITGYDGALTLHSTKTEKNDSVGNVPEGYTGYIIADPAPIDKRTLVLYQGTLGYISNMYIKRTEISADQYPAELLKLTSDDAGKTVLEGAAGPLEK